MRGFQRKYDFKRYLYSTPFLIVLAAITILFAKGAIEMAGKERENTKLVDGLEAKATALTLREQELESNIERLNTSEGVYEEIRERFNVVEEGEEVVIIVDPRPSGEGQGEQNAPWYKRFWDAIISKP